jgi:hypothetical protein
MGITGRLVLQGLGAFSRQQEGHDAQTHGRSPALAQARQGRFTRQHFQRCFSGPKKPACDEM